MISAAPVGYLIYKRAEASSDRRLTFIITVPKFQGENFYHNKAIVNKMKNLATQKGCTVAQIALAWVAAQGLISIPGTTKVSRLEENLASRAVVLTEEEEKAVREIVNGTKPVGERFAANMQDLVGH